MKHAGRTGGGGVLAALVASSALTAAVAVPIAIHGTQTDAELTALGAPIEDGDDRFPAPLRLSSDALLALAGDEASPTPAPTVPAEPTRAATPRPTPTEVHFADGIDLGITPRPTAGPTEEPAPTSRPARPAEPQPTSRPAPAATATPTPGVGPSEPPIILPPVPTPPPTPTARPTPTPTTTPTSTPTPTSSPTPSPTPTVTPNPASQADLLLRLDSSDRLRQGKPGRIHLEIGNDGPAEADGVVLRFSVAGAGITRVAAPVGWTCVGSGDQRACTTVQLPPGARVQITITVTPSDELVTLAGSISADTGDPQPQDNSIDLTFGVDN